MKNILLKKFTHLGNRLILKHPPQNHFLIVSTTGLGDTLWATPAIAAIKQQYPHCYLGVLTSSIGMQVLKNNPHIDSYFEMKEPLSKHFFCLRKQLYKEKFNTILLFHASQRLTLPLCSLIGANRIIGTSGINKGLDSLLTNPLPNQRQHEILRRLKITEKIGAFSSKQTLRFYLKKKELLPPRKKGFWIALHPGSKDSFKRWPAENFSELGKLLKQTFPCEILITGTSSEKKLMHSIAQAIPEAQLDSPNRPLRQFAALLQQMDLIVTNDSGPFHLACALNRPVIGIYASTDPAICGPHLALNAHIVSRRAACEPCLKRKCRLPFCFYQIGPEEVLKKIKTLYQLQLEISDVSF